MERSDRRKKKAALLSLLFIFLVGCSSSSPSSSNLPRGEYIFRNHDESVVEVEPMSPVKKGAYPWEETQDSQYPKITKEFFRCNGSSLNPPNIIYREKEIARFYDCGGTQKHSLPLRDGREFIYPILIDLLNNIQTKTQKRVVITCGHCCPEHNTYLDPSNGNQTSKHMLGAEVDFYVQGLEEKPEQVIDIILAYYTEQPKYQGMKEFEGFRRYEKAERSVAIPPWFNKEIFIKLVKKHEGRDCDNRHPYPYISIQVRYDWDRNEQVSYTWDKAFRNFHRW